MRSKCVCFIYRYMAQCCTQVLTISLSWLLFPLLLLLPLTNTWDTFDYNPYKGFCSIIADPAYPHMPFLDFLDYIVLLPFTAILFFCYGGIMWTFCQSKRRVGMHNLDCYYNTPAGI